MDTLLSLDLMSIHYFENDDREIALKMGLQVSLSVLHFFTVIVIAQTPSAKHGLVR